MALAKLAKAQKEISAMPEAIRKDNEKALEYIKYMASRTNVDIKSWDVFDKFAGEPFTVDTEGGDTFRTLLADKRKIGQIFFELLEDAREKKGKAQESITAKMPQLIEALEQRMKSQLTVRQTSLKRSISSHKMRADDYYQRAENERAAMVKLRIELDTLSGGDSVATIRKELDEVLAEGYWTNPVFEDGFLYLNTASNIVNTLKQKRQNVDISVDLGQLAVRIDLNSFHMQVIPYKNNLRTPSHYYHPHVGTGGDICWGNGSGQVSEWTAELKIGSILKLLYSLLQNYSPDAPYDSIQNFKSYAKKYGRIAAGLKHPDRKKKKKATPKLEQMANSNSTSTTVEIPTGGNNSDATA